MGELVRSGDVLYMATHALGLFLPYFHLIIDLYVCPLEARERELLHLIWRYVPR